MTGHSLAEIARRTTAARAAIIAAYGTPQHGGACTLFVNQHLRELERTYWKRHLRTETPAPRQVLDLLEVREHWGEEADPLEHFDLALPGDVTDYVITVRFDSSGVVAKLDMES